MNRVIRLTTALVLAGAPAVASAQLLGGRVGAAAAINVPPVGSTIDGAARTIGDTANGAVDTAARATPSVTVRAGASTRVDRGTRCYYQPDDYYYDPVYRDGYYYCEQRGGGGVAAGAAVSTAK